MGIKAKARSFLNKASQRGSVLKDKAKGLLKKTSQKASAFKDKAHITGRIYHAKAQLYGNLYKNRAEEKIAKYSKKAKHLSQQVKKGRKSFSGTDRERLLPSKELEEDLVNTTGGISRKNKKAKRVAKAKANANKAHTFADPKSLRSRKRAMKNSSGMTDGGYERLM